MPEDNQNQSGESAQPIQTAAAGSVVSPSPVAETANLPSDHSPSPATSIGAKPPGRFKRFLAKIRPENIFPSKLRSKFGKHARFAGIMVIILVIGGGSAAAFYIFGQPKSKPQTVFAAEIAPFSVVNTTPSDGSTNVDEQASITVKFNRPVDANKLQDDFFVTPRIDGTVKQGSNANEVVFKPKVPFGSGTSVKVMIHGDFLSQTGDKLGADFFFGFSTVIPSNGVIFDQNGLYTKLTSAKSNTDQKFDMQVGEDVKAGGKVTLYKASVDQLLQSFVYEDKQSADDAKFTYKDFVHDTVGTSGLSEVKSFPGLKQGMKIDIQQDTGIYLAVATTVDGKQAGWTWIVFNNKGLLVNQDDQKITVGTEDLTNSSTTDSADVSFYNLDKSVQTIKDSSFSGIKQFTTTNEPTTDIIVGKFGGETVVVPLNVPDSLADLRATANYSTLNRYYALTDRPTYKLKETVNFAGFVRQDNDAVYKSAAGRTVKLYVVGDDYTKHLLDIKATVDESGRISGSFPVTNALAPAADSQSHLLTLYAENDSSTITAYDSPILLTSFTVTKAEPKYNFKVSFDKSSYMANEKVQASVEATIAATGQPLANSDVTYNTYTKTFYENDPSSNLAADTSLGSQIGDQDAVLHLDSSGRAKITVNLSKLPRGSSQAVTIQLSAMGKDDTDGSGGASTVVHQGNAIVSFGPGKTDFDANEPLTSHVYATDLNGQPLANKAVQYRYTTYDSDSNGTDLKENVRAAGSATTDSNGYVEISQQISGLKEFDSVNLYVDVKDENNLTIESQTYLYVLSQDSPIVHSDAALRNLDITGTDGHATVGQDLSVNIKSPQAMSVMVSYERGRIYKSEWVSLQKGDNTYTVSVDANLAPSFTLAFQYFYNGQYHNEGTTFQVGYPSQKGSITLTPDKSTYKAGDKVSVKIDSKDSDGKGIPTSMIVGVVDNSIFSLNDRVAPDIFTSFYGWRETAINASSSLLGIGSGGGGCGGGGGDGSSFINRSGATLVWDPTLITNSSGTNTISFVAKKGSWRVYVYSANGDTVVASSQIVVSAQ